MARVSVTGCDFASVGSGFQVDDTHIVTAAHVVEGVAGITVGINGQVVTATIQGMNKAEDVALLETAAPITGHNFTFAVEDPPEGTSIGVLGFPQGENFTAVTGAISALNVQNGPAFDGTGHILQTAAAINGGNSGGPVVSIDGNVVGIVRSTRTGVLANGQVYKQSFQGTNYVSSGASAAKVVASWWQTPAPVSLARCDNTGVATNNQITVKVETPDERGIQVAQSLLIHGQAINSGAYQMAYNIFTPLAQAEQHGYLEWSKDLDTSYWQRIDIASIASTGDGSIVANASLRTSQDPAQSVDGLQSCTVWHMKYTMEWSIAWWEISNVDTTAPAEPC
ncbi:serine protease [Arthrobacter alpinus]|nr:serine protease [Arthrobacter alpinus]